jgi:hypothetical protein
MSQPTTGSVLARWFVALLGLAAILGATVSLAIPLALDVVDRTGVRIACGSGWQPDGGTARHEDTLNHQQHLLVGAQFIVSDYAGECAEKIVDRRQLAAGVGAFGGALALATLLVRYAGSDRPRRRREAPVDVNTDSFNSYAAWL